MGKAGKNPPSKPSTHKGAVKPSPDLTRSDAWQRGRRLRLDFAADEVPSLTRIQFRLRQELDARVLQKNHPLKGEGFEWDKAAWGFSLIFLHYLIWDKGGQPGEFYFSWPLLWATPSTRTMAFRKCFSTRLPHQITRN
jgi:hypothetical protein